MVLTSVMLVPYMKNWKKTTLGRAQSGWTDEDGVWEIIEDRVSMHDVTDQEEVEILPKRLNPEREQVPCPPGWRAQ